MAKFKQNKNQTAAFTLLEVIVSVGILAIIVLALGRMFTNITETSTRARNAILMDQTARRVFDAMAYDFSQAYIRTNMPFKVYAGDGAGFGEQLSFITASRVGLKSVVDGDFLAEARDSHAAVYTVQAADTNNFVFYIERSAPKLIQDGLATKAQLFLAASDFYGNSNTNILKPKHLNVSGQGWAAFKELTSSLVFPEVVDGNNRRSSGVSQVVLLSASFRIDGIGTATDKDDYPTYQFPESENYPRFVDVDLELMSRKDWDRLLLLNGGDEEINDRAQEHREKTQRTYCRRIPMNTRPIEAINFN